MLRSRGWVYPVLWGEDLEEESEGVFDAYFARAW